MGFGCVLLAYQILVSEEAEHICENGCGKMEIQIYKTQMQGFRVF